MSTRAAVYVRQSKFAPEGIDRGIERCRALVAARGWTLAGEFADNDVSASKTRVGTRWADMLEEARAGHIDVVVGVDVDRLVRSIGDLATLIDVGVRVLTVDGEIDLTTADGEFRATMLAGIARFEVRRKAERQVRANDYKARAGKVVRGRRPFGYDADGITVREDEAEAIRNGYAAMAEGATLGEIARDWNDRGLTTGQNGAFRHDNVRLILLNPRNRGAVRRHGEIVSEQAEWEALVSPALFERVERILRDPARRQGHPRARRLLSSIAVCSICGAGATAGGSTRRGVPNYRCSGSTGHFSRMAEPIDEYVTGVICAFLGATRVADLVARGPEGDSLAREANELHSRLDALALDFADGSLTASQLRLASERLRDRLADVERRMLEGMRAAEIGDLAGRDDVRAAWDELTLERRRRVLRALPLKIEITPVGRGVRNVNFEATVRVTKV